MIDEHREALDEATRDHRTPLVYVSYTSQASVSSFESRWDVPIAEVSERLSSFDIFQGGQYRRETTKAKRRSFDEGGGHDRRAGMRTIV